MHGFFLNQLSSNASAVQDTKYFHIVKRVVEALNELKQKQKQGEIRFVASTSDGFLTNPKGFFGFFEPYRSLNITYTVYEGEFDRPRIMKVLNILRAIQEIDQGTKTKRTMSVTLSATPLLTSFEKLTCAFYLASEPV